MQSHLRLVVSNDAPRRLPGLGHPLFPLYWWLVMCSPPRMSVELQVVS